MKKNIILSIAIFAVCVISLAGCGIISTQKTTRGHDIGKSDVNAIQRGVTTERDILKMFGPPTKQRPTDSGKEFLYEYAESGGLRWNLVFSIGGGTDIKSLIVWFDKQNVVEDYAFKNS